MSAISSLTAPLHHQLGQQPDPVEEARGLKQAFGQFVGESLFGSMLKSMRETVGEPAYFHGGSAERHFQTRLDAQMAKEMAAGQGASISEAMFRQQFPQQAELLAEADASALAELDTLRRF